MNSVYIDSAVAASPIYIGPTNANSVIIGNTNSRTTIQGLPFNSFAGQPLVGYNVSTGVNANIPTGIEIASTVENNTNQGGRAYIDFHTNQKGFVDYDARIMATGGSSVTAATMQAGLNYYAASHNFAGNVNMGTGSNITLQPATGLVVPITGQLGYRYTLVNAAGPYTMTGVGTAQEVTNFSVPPGVWLYEAQAIVGSSFAVAYFEWYLSSASATVDLTRVCGGCITVQGIWSRNTGIISNTATTTWYLNAKAAVANVQYTNINICLTRIA